MAKPRLHKSSIAVGLIAALLLVFICIPGRVMYASPPSTTIQEHGWPFVYLLRQASDQDFGFAFHSDPLTQLPMLGVPWLSADNWKLWQADANDGTPRRKFYAASLVADGIIVPTLLAAVVLTWEFRRRRRSRLFSVSLVDMFAMVAAVCGVLGWGANLHREYQHEQHVLERNRESDLFTVDDTTCAAPLWIQSLMGRLVMPANTWRVSSATIWGFEGANLKRLQDELTELPYLSDVSVATDDDYFPFATFAFLPGLKKLRLLDSSAHNGFLMLDEEDIPQLAQFVRLEKLVIQKRQLDPEIVSQLQIALPSCQIIDEFEDDW